MNKYENLITKAEKENLYIVEKQFTSKAKGLIKNNKIGIRQNIPTITEKTCVLAEELVHYFTSNSDILDQTKIENVKQEKRARNWAYEKLISLDKLIVLSFILEFGGITAELITPSFYSLKNFLDISENSLAFEIIAGCSPSSET